ncbi:HGxxPAAW family protein [Planobispora siamensis]|uniref:Uncharacterized protein n=1 Tax=Planobispora siamensis TaxID=936338 RepID=A0A8J3S879_9ACTN|nr:HGxxPAAW family protein [Planobispora siamensis]GIH89737.1 hypothetical protein Psi01_03670 [Planobispora siamensis]
MAETPPGASHAGRALSWLAVTVSLLGFAIGGIALTAGPNWLVFWMGVAVCMMGCVLLLFFGAFKDVILDSPRAPFERSDGILD